MSIAPLHSYRPGNADLDIAGDDFGATTIGNAFRELASAPHTGDGEHHNLRQFPDRLSSVDLRLVPSFLVLSEELHFGRAAQRLHLAQPALSQQLKRLEAQVGVKLVERSTRRVELTAAGLALARELPSGLARIDEAIAVARQAARLEVGTIPIAGEVSGRVAAPGSPPGGRIAVAPIDCQARCPLLSSEDHS